MSYYHNVNNQIFEMISGDVSSICEFGCGSGGMAIALKEKFNNLHYVGVDISFDQLVIGAKNFDSAVHCDLDQLGIWESDEFKEKIPDYSFDYIIFGDVLEHLKSPELAIRNAKTKIKEEGRVIISIPNVQHWSVFVNLINGSWPRADQGIFDKTHLRWFTLSEIEKILEFEGFEVDNVVSRVLVDNNADKVAEFLRPLAEACDANFDNLLSGLKSFQYVISAKNKKI